MKTCTTCGAEWPDDLKFCPNDGATLRSARGGSDLVGSVIADRYHIEKKLGEGGMGAVYLGEHVKMGRKSAIKVMAQSMANDPEAIARFNREAANAARINHHNVCAIYDFGETDDGLIYLAMEFIEGEALSDLLRREGALPPPRAASILAQTAGALQAAHDLGIVHRDLKPDNIMLAKSRGGEDVVKVVDFGIAKAMTGEEGQKVTKTGLVVGTPEYMSPEQLSGDKLDGRSDLYSLGLVLFRMLTGTLPFHADTAQETMIKRLTDDPMRLAEALPAGNFPAKLQEALDQALQRMPGERYGSAADFARDVERAVADIAGTPAFDSQGATQVLDAGATELLPATRVDGAKREPPTPTTPQPLPAATERPKRTPNLAVAAALAVVIVGGGTYGAMKMMGGSSDAGPGVTPGTEIGTPAGDSGGAPDGGQAAGNRTTPGGTRTGAQTERGGDAQPGGQPETVTDPGTETAPTVDEAAIEADLLRITDAILEDVASAADRARLEEIYYNDDVPAALRGRAALNLGNYFALIAMDNTAACRWYRLANERDPNNPTIMSALNSPSCAP